MSIKGAIGLTGGIACGKSESAAVLAELGVPVLDTDAVAHSLLEPGHSVSDRIVQAFGREYELAEGGIDRKKLGSHIFKNEAARNKLNAMMHPAVYERVDQWLVSTLAENNFAVVMIPLLYETGSESRFEKIIVVAADDQLVMSRLKARGLTGEEAEARIRSQMPVGEKVSRADCVIMNNGDLDELRKNTITIWNRQILGKENK